MIEGIKVKRRVGPGDLIKTTLAMAAGSQRCLSESRPEVQGDGELGRRKRSIACWRQMSRAPQLFLGVSVNFFSTLICRFLELFLHLFGVGLYRQFFLTCV